MQLQRYDGSPDRPVPPTPEAWQSVPAHDVHARRRAAELVASMPAYHFVDERGPNGIYRFFGYETAFGLSVSALRRELELEPSYYGGGGTLGQTNPNFKAAAPASAPNGATSATQDAGLALLNYLDSNGVPNETTPTPAVGAFQSAYNADPIAAGANGQLNVDQEYGPNTHDALAAIVGAVAPGQRRREPYPRHAAGGHHGADHRRAGARPRRQLRGVDRRRLDAPSDGHRRHDRLS